MKTKRKMEMINKTKSCCLNGKKIDKPYQTPYQEQKERIRVSKVMNVVTNEKGSYNHKKYKRSYETTMKTICHQNVQHRKNRSILEKYYHQRLNQEEEKYG